MYVYHFTDTIAMKKFNMTPEGLFNTCNLWPVHAINSSHFSADNLNVKVEYDQEEEGNISYDWFPPDGMTGPNSGGGAPEGNGLKRMKQTLRKARQSKSFMQLVLTPHISLKTVLSTPTVKIALML